jgi:hypothetical protein
VQAIVHFSTGPAVTGFCGGVNSAPYAKACKQGNDKKTRRRADSHFVFDSNESLKTFEFQVFKRSKKAVMQTERRALGEADFLTNRALKLAPNNEEVKKLRDEVVKLPELEIN